MNDGKPIRVLVCGDREWTDEGSIALFLMGLPEGSVIIHGACRGADTVAGRIAREIGLEVEEYPAEWDVYGRAAGPIRNRQMIAEGKPGLVAAFHDDIENSKGTRDMIDVANKAGIQAILFLSEGDDGR